MGSGRPRRSGAGAGVGRHVRAGAGGRVAHQGESADSVRRPVGLPVRLPQPAGNCRVEKFDIDRRCAEFGISDLTRIELPTHIRGRQLSGPEMSRLADNLAGHLADIKRTIPGRELVVVAFVSKTVSLLIGWHLSRQQVRFFADTSLMHHVLPEDRFVALRVHPSQPTTFPAPRRET